MDKPYIKIPIHRYECPNCVIHFMVEQAFEEQYEITCPVCHDEDIEDLGPGEVRY
jgi:predicted nucleic acid-binding Zn ribbon protein